MKEQLPDLFLARLPLLRLLLRLDRESCWGHSLTGCRPSSVPAVSSAGLISLGASQQSSCLSYREDGVFLQETVFLFVSLLFPLKHLSFLRHKTMQQHPHAVTVEPVCSWRWHSTPGYSNGVIHQQVLLKTLWQASWGHRTKRWWWWCP